MWLSRLREGFAARFGRLPTVIARAPGRVNLLGEHTDYNEGFVLPVALRQSTWFACAPRDDNIVRVASANFNEPAFGRTNPPDERFEAPASHDPAKGPLWTRYVLGVAALLRERGAHLGGFDALIDGDLPIGGGLSSSAALEVSAALALSAIAGEALVATELIDLCVDAERRFASVPCGVMDQSASLLGKEGHALLLDCRERCVEQIPLNLGDHVLLLLDGGPRTLATTEYAHRREECAAAVEHFRRINPHVRSLRDVSLESVRAQAFQMPPLAAARALHVASENRRVLDGVEALRRGDMATFGRLMNESHRSMRDDFEVSTESIDELVSGLLAMSGVVGARLTGAGFGGAILVLARTPLEALLRPENEVITDFVRVGPGAALELA